MDLIKVLPIIETRLVANIFANVLGGEQDIEVVGCATNAQAGQVR